MVKCENCRKNMTEKSDANVVAFLGFVPKIFCNDCYSTKERGLLRHIIYLPGYPINSKKYILRLAGFTIFSVIFLSFLFIGLLIPEALSVPYPFVLGLALVWTFFLIWDWVLYFLAKQKISRLK